MPATFSARATAVHYKRAPELGSSTPPLPFIVSNLLTFPFPGTIFADEKHLRHAFRMSES
jgi:hypothetical protein